MRQMLRSMTLAAAMMLLVAVGAVSSSAAPLGAPLSSVSNSCPASGVGYRDWVLPALTGDHPVTLFRVTTSNGSGDFWPSSASGGSFTGYHFGSGDTIWQLRMANIMGSGMSGVVNCWSSPTNPNFTIELFDAPDAPTSFAGKSSMSGDDGGSNIAFHAVGGAPFVADISTLTSPIAVTSQSATRVALADTTLALGNLAAGYRSVHIEPYLGGTPSWSVAIRPLPVSISTLGFAAGTLRPGTAKQATFSVDGDSVLTATIKQSSTTIRTLTTNMSVALGNHSIAWDGLDQSGQPVADGTYTLHVSSADLNGLTSASTTDVIVDGTPPEIRSVHFAKPANRGGLSTNLSYSLDEPTTVSVRIEAAGVISVGNPLQQLQKSQLMPAGSHSIAWNGLNRDGLPAWDGIYTAFVSSEGLGGRTRDFTTTLILDNSAPLILGLRSSANRPVSTMKGQTLSPLLGIRVAAIDDGQSDLASLTVMVDGNKVAGAASPINFRPLRGWWPGKHSVAITATDGAGNTTAKTWRFLVLAPAPKMKPGKAQAYLRVLLAQKGWRRASSHISCRAVRIAQRCSVVMSLGDGSVSGIATVTYKATRSNKYLVLPDGFVSQVILTGAQTDHYCLSARRSGCTKKVLWSTLLKPIGRGWLDA